jgi:hypothetical protein
VLVYSKNNEDLLEAVGKRQQRAGGVCIANSFTSKEWWIIYRKPGRWLTIWDILRLRCCTAKLRVCEVLAVLRSEQTWSGTRHYMYCTQRVI